MHFTFDGKVYKQVDGVCMGSPLGPVIANVFMVALEEEIAPKLQPIMPMGRRYVDDTFTFVKKNCITEVVQKINSFHPNIKFTHEIERDKKIAFLDVLLSRKDDGGLDTSVYRKPTTTTYTFTGMRTDPDNGKSGPYLVSSDEHMKYAQQKRKG